MDLIISNGSHRGDVDWECQHLDTVGPGCDSLDTWYPAAILKTERVTRSGHVSALAWAVLKLLALLERINWSHNNG